MVCTHDSPPTDPAQPEPDPLGQRHSMWTWDVHNDIDNVGILVYPCTKCGAWIIACQLCGQVADAKTRRPALSIAAAHGSTKHIDGCQQSCAACEASWARAAASLDSGT